MAEIAAQGISRGGGKASAGLALTALGIVFGDIGTSPLYTLKTVIDLAGGHPSPEAALGLLSLVVWTLIITTSLKYVAVMMRIDNEGEGGIMALMSLLGVKNRPRFAIVAIGLFGAALIYGDGVITPAISVLSALEGLEIEAPGLTPYVLPASVAVLVLLFAVQSLGTARIGGVFGPVMTLWFVVIAVLGFWGIWQYPAVLAALDPRYGAMYLASGGTTGFLVLGGVFLAVTGAEALYADMGHIGARPIRLAWYGLVLPALVLNYAGQTALILSGAPIEDNIFYRLCPAPLLLPLVILATLATIIASQSIITGAFSMTRQAIQLGWFPRLRITQTSEHGYGQIYIRAANWIMMVLTVALTIGFGKSDNLAAAYGIAVSLTMLLTTMLLFVAMREIWHWGLSRCLLVAGSFFCIDAAFFAANAAKVMEGGWVPLALAVIAYSAMMIWHRGQAAVAERLKSFTQPIDTFFLKMETECVARVPGSAIFLTKTKKETPPLVALYVRYTKSLHRHVLALTVVTESVPYVAPGARLTVKRLAPEFWRAKARYGFMERPDIPALLHQAHSLGCTLDLDNVTYFVGHETVVRLPGGQGLPRWQQKVYAFMERNSAHVADLLRLPRDQVVEIGRYVEI